MIDGGCQPARLLGRHVVGCAQNVELAGESGGGGCILADTEVQELHVARLAGHADQEDVGRLQIAVNDPGCVCEREAGGDLERDAHRFGERDLALAIEPIGQALAVQELHHDVGGALVGGVVVDHLHDMWMLKAADDVGFAVEASEGVADAGEVLSEDLHGHAPAQAHVLGIEHHAHAALIEDPQNAIGVAQGLADQITPGAFGGVFTGSAHIDGNRLRAEAYRRRGSVQMAEPFRPSDSVSGSVPNGHGRRDSRVRDSLSRFRPLDLAGGSRWTPRKRSGWLSMRGLLVDERFR